MIQRNRFLNLLVIIRILIRVRQLFKLQKQLSTIRILNFPYCSQDGPDTRLFRSIYLRGSATFPFPSGSFCFGLGFVICGGFCRVFLSFFFVFSVGGDSGLGG